MDRDGVILEVGMNEAVSRAVHPAVPRQAGDCAADAQRCAEAGATIVHWHAIDAAGGQRLGDADLYGAALDAMDGCVLAYPSYPVDAPDTVDARLAHCFALRREHGLELGPVDVASVNFVLWNEAARTLAPLEPQPELAVIRNSLPFVAEALARYKAVGLVPTLASFDLGSTRTIGALALSGLVDEPIMVKIFLWGSPMIGPEPSVEALDLHLRQLPQGIDVEWVLVPHGIVDRGLVEELARAALERGGGVRVGIGDTPGAFPELSNPEIVEVAVGWAGDAGRPVASLPEVRARLSTTPSDSHRTGP
jgi:3-keto-5-aminohexanoate cleavage enzyme